MKKLTLIILLVHTIFSCKTKTDKEAFDKIESNKNWSLKFSDDCTEKWKKNWSLDGLKADVKNTSEGMILVLVQ